MNVVALGHIIEDIQKAGYTISAIQQFHVDSVNAEEFLEVYKGVLAEYGVSFESINFDDARFFLKSNMT